MEYHRGTQQSERTPRHRQICVADRLRQRPTPPAYRIPHREATTMKLELTDAVALTHPISEEGLEAGDIGAIVSVYDVGAYDVEFANEYGETIAILTLREP